MKISKRDKRALLALYIFAVVMIVGYFFVMPSVRRSSELDDEIKNLKETKETAEKKSAALSGLEEKNELLKKLLESDCASFAPLMDSEEIATYLTGITSENEKVDLVSLKMSEKKDTDLIPYAYSEKKLKNISHAGEQAFGIVGLDTPAGAADVKLHELSAFEADLKLSGTQEDILACLEEKLSSSGWIRLVRYTPGEGQADVKLEIYMAD